MLCPECGVVAAPGPLIGRDRSEDADPSETATAGAISSGPTLGGDESKAVATQKRVADAKLSFGKLMAWTTVAGVIMSIGAVSFLSYTSGSLSWTVLVATFLGVFLSVLLGAGLMAVGFFSSNSGHDDDAAGNRDGKQGQAG